MARENKQQTNITLQQTDGGFLQHLLEDSGTCTAANSWALTRPKVADILKHVLKTEILSELGLNAEAALLLPASGAMSVPDRDALASRQAFGVLMWTATLAIKSPFRPTEAPDIFSSKRERVGAQFTHE
jgi:hypothetical protein